MRPFGIRVTIDMNFKFELRMQFPLPVLDWRGHSILLLRFQRGRRIEWEVWR